MCSHFFPLPRAWYKTIPKFSKNLMHLHLLKFTCCKQDLHWRSSNLGQEVLKKPLLLYLDARMQVRTTTTTAHSRRRNIHRWPFPQQARGHCHPGRAHGLSCLQQQPTRTLPKNDRPREGHTVSGLLMPQSTRTYDRMGIPSCKHHYSAS